MNLLLHNFIILDITSLICFPQSSSSDDEEVDSYKYEEALEYCAEEGPMKMPYYSSHFESLGSCKTIGGPNSGKPCIFPFIWKNFTEKGETFYGKLYEYIILKSFKILNILTYITFRLSRRSKWKTLVLYKS